ncbi:MAG: phosphate ABC transporter substrate-binding protein [Flavobacterium sp.]|uniref:PstS family phosphate ABC transporter substrate-binding protein n=1 Tax=Flavobacterium sp. TaxID=239 RepID=UPI00121036FE|nr:substrate-binding domain-containing protein [Flavobacterium sp.]RZJ66496.1 MAG: phosphate ABC transporter substrate-binding protein [Flavobacterium sp.]
MSKKIVPIVALFGVFFLFMCNRKSEAGPANETILTGETSMLVDETLSPIVEDVLAVFESQYNAKINLIPKSENEALQSFFKDSAKVIIMSRDLNAEEKKFFDSKKRYPKSTKFATDAIALIGSKGNDSIVALQDVVDFMKGKSVSGIKGMVFDNPNSGTVRFMNELSGISALPEKNVYSFKTNSEVIKFVSENPGMIGVVGINWVLQPTQELESYLKKINVLSVKGLSSVKFVSPTQNNLAEGTYPLARDLYIVNAQGYEGLGMGFASFIAGERGQRIILKSGLLPVRIPSRKIVIKKEEKTQ